MKMERWSCEKDLDEIIDLTVVDWEIAPNIELAEREEVCFLCQKKAKYRLFYEPVEEGLV
jgi:CxxH/CxxC protein (TIGR04129 family)